MTASDLAAESTTQTLLSLFNGAEVSAEDEFETTEALSPKIRIAVKDHLRRWRSSNGVDTAAVIPKDTGPSKISDAMGEAKVETDSSVEQNSHISGDQALPPYDSLVIEQEEESSA